MVSTRLTRGFAAAGLTLVATIPTLMSLPDDPRTVAELFVIYLGMPWSWVVPTWLEDLQLSSDFLNYLVWCGPFALNIGLIASMLPISGSSARGDG